MDAKLRSQLLRMIRKGSFRTYSEFWEDEKRLRFKLNSIICNVSRKNATVKHNSAITGKPAGKNGNIQYMASRILV
ncbi:hypothetical protein VNO80_19430 [Phaseolus coccineus]|uniref:Uncharacterized protein n=1 Tax=Phaseolus coccineus TaxID=3886 RepID=A0AAN9R0M6_PHACN